MQWLDTLCMGNIEEGCTILHVLTCSSQNFGASRPSFQLMSFKKLDDDPYQQSFLLHTSSLREHKEVPDRPTSETRVSCVEGMHAVYVAL